MFLPRNFSIDDGEGLFKMDRSMDSEQENFDDDSDDEDINVDLEDYNFLSENEGDVEASNKATGPIQLPLLDFRIPAPSNQYLKSASLLMYQTMRCPESAGHRDDVDSVKMMFELGNEKYPLWLVHGALKSAVSNGLVNLAKLLLRRCADQELNSSLPENFYYPWIDEVTRILVFQEPSRRRLGSLEICVEDNRRNTTAGNYCTWLYATARKRR
ncbi:unnamed protein product [Trichogramma brassicae]|uniref:Uncharacterized protein n=1 Tax=Trichogramma brassicae TaxID=86971 RepID=A0A6H5HVW1_9HYME|nr:unnamed protein product [Trichogramma brassicae]